MSIGRPALSDSLHAPQCRLGGYAKSMNFKELSFVARSLPSMIKCPGSAGRTFAACRWRLTINRQMKCNCQWRLLVDLRGLPVAPELSKQTLAVAASCDYYTGYYCGP